MFKMSLILSEKNKWRRVLSFQLSLLIHAILILIILVVPLLSVRNLPKVEVNNAFLAPPPPPPPAKKRTTAKRRTRIRPVQSQTTVEPGKLVAPVEIPDEIAEEELSDIGIEGDVSAVKKGRVGKRIVRRAAGRVAGKGFRKLFK